MKTLVVYILILLVAIPAFGYEMESGQPYGMAETVMLSNPSGAGFLSCPVGIMQDRQFLFESGWQRRFELSDLDEVFFAAGYRRGKLAIGAEFSQMGKSDYYTEKILRSTATYYHKSFTASLIASGKIIDIGGGYGQLKAAGIGMAAGVHINRYHLGLVVDNINKPKIAENRDGENPLYEFYAEIEGGPFHSVMGKVRFEKDYDPGISLAQYIRVYDQHALFWGISHNPLTYGGGVELAYRSLRLVYSANYHPALGFTHNISVKFSTRKSEE